MKWHWSSGPYQQYDPRTKRGLKWYQLTFWSKRWYVYLNITPRVRA